MRRFFVWFYHICIRMSELDMSKIGDGGKKYRTDELPSAQELERLDREFKERNKNRPLAGH